MQWDYGKPARGESLDKVCFYENLTHLVDLVEPLWYDDYLERQHELQNLVLQKAEEMKPDLILFIPYTDQFSVNTLEQLKKRFSTYAWFGDDQWRFNSYSSKLAPHFTYVSTTDPWSVTKYKKLGITPIVTQWAAQKYSEDISPISCGESYQYEVSFVGGKNRYRTWFINELAKHGIQVECFGADWPNGRVSYLEMEQIFRKSKINLNISNSIGQDTKFILSSLRNLTKCYRAKKTSEQIKARNFEIPLAGGFQLSNYVLGLERYLNVGQEVAVYTSTDECVQQIQYYLENEDLRQQITVAGHERTKAEHTYTNRLAHILGEIWD